MERKRILLVEDDQNLGTVLQDFLELENFTVTLCANGDSGKKTFDKYSFDLIILDIMLPLLDGFTLGEYIRKTNQHIPLIFLTAKSMKEDRIRGLKLGADDYITKPFSTEELVLRINAVLRRSTSITSQNNFNEEQFILGSYTFNYTEQLLIKPNKNKPLTKKEANVLRMLCIHKNHLLKREVALKEIWGENDYFMGRSMDVYITKLRKILKDDPAISIINVHNSGFKLSINEESTDN